VFSNVKTNLLLIIVCYHWSTCVHSAINAGSRVSWNASIPPPPSQYSTDCDTATCLSIGSYAMLCWWCLIGVVSLRDLLIVCCVCCCLMSTTHNCLE